MSRVARARLAAYRAGYEPLAAGAGPGDRLDAGVRAADAYVAAHDPLRGEVAHPSWPATVADVALGVEPGAYFCGGLAHVLAGCGDGARVGFIHVPPDASLPRPILLDLLGVVVSGVLTALAAERPWRLALITGFGPFPGVADNPTAAFVADPARIVAVGGGRVRTAVLHLAAADGTVHATMAPVLAQLDLARARVGGPDVVIGLGVDSRQALVRPRFTIETQSRGMRERIDGCERGPGEVALPLDDLALAMLGADVFRGGR